MKTVRNLVVMILLTSPFIVNEINEKNETPQQFVELQELINEITSNEE